MSEDATLDDFVEPESDSSEPEKEDLARKTVCGIPPQDWTVARLGELVRVVSGNSLPTKYQNENEAEHPVYKVSDMNTVGNEKYISDSSNWLSEEELGKLNHTLYPEGTIILPKVGAALLTNKRRILTEPSSFDNNVMGWVPDEINSEFLYYVSRMIDMEAVAQKGAVPSISKAIAKSLKIPSPQPSEQHKIATVLYTVDRVIEKTEEIISQTERLKQGVMNDLFEKGYYDHSEYDEVRIGPFLYEKPTSWDIRTIEESKDGENGLRRGPFGGMLKKEIFVDSGFKVYQQQNVIYDDFDYGDYYVTEEKFRDMERFSIDSGDILISCSGTLGKIAVVPEDHQEGVINQALLKFTVDEEMFQTQYMKYFLESRIGQRQLILSSRGSAMKNMAPMEFVRSSRIFMPPVNEQKKISSALLSLDRKIDTEKKKKDNLNNLRQSLMKDLLSGTVRTTDTNIEVPDEITQHG